jgi:ubiquinone biosynthesis protein COQ9
LSDALLDAVLAHVPFDGWSERALAAAARDLGVDPALALNAFPGGPIDMISAFSARADVAMLEALVASDVGALKVRERIALAVRLRLEAVARHREAERRAVAFGALPQNAPRMLALAYRTVDLIWQAAGDQATDFNHYTKRALLLGVYAATLAHWLADESQDQAATWAFLDRRIADVLKIETVKAAAGALAARLPSPIGVLARLRYGRNA